MAFPTGWGRRVPVVIQASKVDANLTDFTVLVTEANLPVVDNEIFDADGSNPARADGGDIRFSSDQAGTTPLAREVKEFTRDNNPANGTAEIWVKVGSVSSSSNTTIYIWYNAPGETEPAADSAYGSENAWDANYKAVYHLEESSGAVGDSTSNANTLTAFGSPAYGAGGKVGSAITFNDATPDYFKRADILGLTDWPLTMTAWANTDDNTVLCTVTGLADSDVSNQRTTMFFRGDSGDKAEVQIVSGGGALVFGTTVFTQGQWHHVASVTANATSHAIFVDGGNKETSGVARAFPSNMDNTAIGTLFYSSDAPNFSFSGQLDEVRFSSVARSDAWIKAEYESANDPNAFAPDGAPEAPPTTVKPAWYYQRNAMRRAA